MCYIDIKVNNNTYKINMTMSHFKKNMFMRVFPELRMEKRKSATVAEIEHLTTANFPLHQC